ncbi:hypothetical protein [Piscinibacter gummiphilus]|uniref:Uncharacterized protein n=1 Tax=Piscinibacter gummiphilus TaxID=946333 RepID=A0A1W6LEJ5_9BURK|nr:hypothetical protein [Piscinibacter gummiphilus]ARN22637.1 hypothetical protein A4W93_23500 [Piscinibacter gummiphilus]GLS97680.1 hemolytic protein HlpA [Piscinibacter gummiphilus]
MSIRSPILFLVFNRPDTTARVFEAIRAARPPRLYVASDGPRAGRPDEAARCDEVRRIATAVDWPCEVKTLLRPENLGCKRAVSSGISWFFEQEPEGIVIEDDCVPDPSFFTYCDELLERYRDDPRVMCISGDNFISSDWKPDSSYYFSKYIHVWGWASWRRAWNLYDVEMRDWSAQDKAGLLERRFPNAPRAQAHWRELFDRVSTGRIDTWDYQWNYACLKHDGVSCMPEVNLISNIGFGQGATHTVSPESKLANLPVSSLSLPLRHPDKVAADVRADQWTSDHVFDIDERNVSLKRLRRAVTGRLRRVWSLVAS